MFQNVEKARIFGATAMNAKLAAQQGLNKEAAEAGVKTLLGKIASDSRMNKAAFAGFYRGVDAAIATLEAANMPKAAALLKAAGEEDLQMGAAAMEDDAFLEDQAIAAAAEVLAEASGLPADDPQVVAAASEAVGEAVAAAEEPQGEEIAG